MPDNPVENDGEWPGATVHGKAARNTLSGFLVLGAVATLLAGSPFRNMKCIGKLASIARGASFNMIHDRFFHGLSNTENYRALSTLKFNPVAEYLRVVYRGCHKHDAFDVIFSERVRNGSLTIAIEKTIFKAVY